MNVYFISLGCSKNLIDSEQTIGLFDKNKVNLVEDPMLADVIFVNTCGFILSAKQEAIDTILAMANYKTIGRCQKLVAMGCFIQRYLEEVKKELSEVDYFIPIDDYDQMDKILSEIFDLSICGSYGKQYRYLTKDVTSSYLKIGEGCNNRCAYCAIPLIRGNFRSYPMADIINEAQDLVKQGCQELVLIAQDTTLYGYDFDQEYHLKDLLVELNKLDLKWIRILYMYPDLLSKELIDTMNSLDKVLMYFDLPLQHGNNKMLKLMNRRGTIEKISSMIDYIRSLNVPYVLRTTMIVGFNYETEEDFSDLLKFINEIKFDKLGAFTYSKEEDTLGYDYDEDIEESVKQERYDRLMLEQSEISYQLNQKLIGQQLEVLIESYDSLEEYYIGRSLYNAPDDIDGIIKIYSDNNLELNKFYQVKIIDGDSYDLVGEIC
ncbi:MAG: 30S ribosomal protein S12 methylthiotransferase RimO [Erysipelotrichaceae bacterium]